MSGICGSVARARSTVEDAINVFMGCGDHVVLVVHFDDAILEQLLPGKIGRATGGDAGTRREMLALNLRREDRASAALAAAATAVTIARQSDASLSVAASLGVGSFVCGVTRLWHNRGRNAAERERAEKAGDIAGYVRNGVAAMGLPSCSGSAQSQGSAGGNCGNTGLHAWLLRLLCLGLDLDAQERPIFATDTSAHIRADEVTTPRTVFVDRSESFYNALSEDVLRGACATRGIALGRRDA